VVVGEELLDLGAEGLLFRAVLEVQGEALLYIERETERI
jgi:hypothetical protein